LSKLKPCVNDVISTNNNDESESMLVDENIEDIAMEDYT